MADVLGGWQNSEQSNLQKVSDEFKANMADVLGGWQNSLTLAILKDAAAWYSEHSDLDEARIKETEKMADGFKEHMAEVLKNWQLFKDSNLDEGRINLDEGRIKALADEFKTKMKVEWSDRIKATEQKMADEFGKKMKDVLGGWQSSHRMAILTDAVAGYSEQSDLD